MTIIYERFKEQRARTSIEPCTTDEQYSFSFPREPSRSILSTNKPKQLSTQSNDSGFTSQLALSRTVVLSPAISIEKSTPHPSTSQHAQVAQLAPKGHFSPIQQFIRNSAKLRSKEPKYNRSQPAHPDSQSVLRTLIRQGYEL